MKKTKRPAKTLPLSAEQQQAIVHAWQQLLDECLPDDVIWLSAPFEQEAGVWYLRAYLETTDKTISLDRCTALTRLLDEHLERLPIPSDFAYHLEISSPGLFRQLTTTKELLFYQGEPVRVVRPGHAPIDGTLEAFDEAAQTLSLVPSTIISTDHAALPAIAAVSLPWTPDLVVTLNYPLTHLEDAADD